MLRLTITRSTFLKARPLQSSELLKHEILGISKNQELKLENYTRDRNKHWKITLKEPLAGYKDWFVFQGHSEIQALSELPAIHVLNNVPFKSQLDNRLNPTGSCNVTSLAMCLEFLKAPRRQSNGQFEDELYEYAIAQGYNRHSPQDLAQIVRDYGKKDDFTVWGTFDRCKDHLAVGNPCVIHGYFTSFGHIIVLVGYDDKGFIVHDPYGEWFSSGYRTDLSGEFLHYSYGLIERTCIPDGQFWVHYISS